MNLEELKLRLRFLNTLEDPKVPLPLFKNFYLFQRCNYSNSCNFKSQINCASKSRIFFLTQHPYTPQLFFISYSDPLYSALRGPQEIYLLTYYTINGHLQEKTKFIYFSISYSRQVPGIIWTPVTKPPV